MRLVTDLRFPADQTSGPAAVLVAQRDKPWAGLRSLRERLQSSIDPGRWPQRDLRWHRAVLTLQT